MDRLKHTQSIRQDLRRNQPVVGSWMQIGDSNVAEIMGRAGYRFVAIDMEHGPIGLSQLPDIFRALELGNTLPLARVASPSPINCRQALDQGAAGVVIPMISSAIQLQEIIEQCFWPPRGRRGVGFSRANGFGKFFDDYRQEAQHPLVVAQIESIDAVNNLDSILGVDGLDAIMVGPYDLSASLGITGEFDNDKFVEVLEKILGVCAKQKMPCGIHVVNPDLAMLSHRISQGFTLMVYGVDTVFLNNGSAAPK